MSRLLSLLVLLPVRLWAGESTPDTAASAAAPVALPSLPVAAGEDVIGMFGSVLLMAVLLFAGLWFLRRLRSAQRPQQAGVAVVSQIPLGMKEKLLVLQVGEERLLVGCTPASMQTLHRWEAGELPEPAPAADFAALLKNAAGWQPQRGGPVVKVMKWLLPLLCLLPLGALAADPLSLPAVSSAANAAGGQEYSVSLQLLAIMTALTLLPALLLGMTAFTRIMIVLSILRQALGTGQTPSNQVLLSLSLFLTLFVMYPIGEQAYAQAVAPYLAEQMTFQEAVTTGFEPFRSFMLSQTREDDIARFAEIAGHEAYQKPEDVPFSVLMASFLTSELKTAFQIGFLVFIPFVVIDLVVASVLMSMGMMMLSPMMISLPFKIMLFVLVDGWGLMMGSLAASFYR